MTTSQSKLIQLAKQGDPKAIAALMNRQLQAKGILAKVALKDQCLQIVLETHHSLDSQSLVSYIHRGIVGLAIPSLQTIRIYEKQMGEEFPTWVEEIELRTKCNQSLNNLGTVKQKDEVKLSKQPDGSASQPMNQQSLRSPDKANFLSNSIDNFQTLTLQQKRAVVLVLVQLALIGGAVFYKAWTDYWELYRLEHQATEEFRRATEEADRKVEQLKRERCSEEPASCK